MDMQIAKTVFSKIGQVVATEFVFFFLPSRYPRGPGGVIFHKPQGGGGPGNLEYEKPEIAKKNVTPPTFWKLLGHLRTPRKKNYIPVFHAGGHCGLRLVQFIDFLANC